MKKIFSVHDFIMDTLKRMSEHYEQFQVQEFALDWYAKGKLTEDDLATVESWFAEAEE